MRILLAFIFAMGITSLLAQDFPEIDLWLKEEMPYLLQCDSLDRIQREHCTSELLLSYLRKTLRHPGIPPSDTSRKVMVLQFYIDSTGQVSGPVKVYRDFGPEYSEQLLKRVNEMIEDKSMRWQPALSYGKQVKVQYNVPIRYDYFKQNSIPPPPPKPREEEIFKVVAEMPRFPGCEGLPKAERDTCSKRKFTEFVYKNLYYPREAYENRQEGNAIIEFVIGKNGSLYDAKIKSDPGFGMGEAALKAVQMMERADIRWTPQSSRFRPVRVQFHHIVSFRLDAGIPVEE